MTAPGYEITPSSMAWDASGKIIWRYPPLSQREAVVADVEVLAVPERVRRLLLKFWEAAASDGRVAAV